jgi:hypothetical protein
MLLRATFCKEDVFTFGREPGNFDAPLDNNEYRITNVAL